MGEDHVVLSEELYKQTVAFDYVVKRHVQLYSNRFVTFADAAVPEEHRTYWLDDTARLSPERKDALQQKKRYLRPPGVGSMTALAAVRGKGALLELWTFKLKRDEHSDFTFCFQDQAQAYRWFDALSQVISELRSKSGKEALPSAFSHQSSLVEGRQSSLVEGRQSSLVEGRDNLAPLAGSPFLRSRGTVGSEMYSLPPEDSVGVSLMFSGPPSAPQDEEEELTRLLNVPPGETTRFHQRWVPYRHSNGLAIYQHYSREEGAPPEYMVSAVVRGSPSEVLRVLVDPHSATTILGPALELEVLDSKNNRQTQRILLQAEGPNAAWFRPREAVVERVLKKEEDGVYVLLFKSVDTTLAASNIPSEGVIEVAEGLDERVCRTNPLRCRVFGGYTVSKLRGATGNDSHETLLTCVLQVADMGGWLNPRHPLFRVVNWWSGGAYEAFLERMLLGVMLVRDIVEKSRFAVTSQLYQRDSEGGAGARQAPRSSSILLRRAANSASVAGARRTSAPLPRGQSYVDSPAAAAPPAPPGGTSPFQAPGAMKPLYAQVAEFQQQQLVKVSRLASQRLGSGPVQQQQWLGSGPVQQQQQQRLRSAGGAVGAKGVDALEPTAAAAMAAVAAEGQRQQWDASFKLPEKYYEEIHTPGHESPFKVRGRTYFKDGVKVSPPPPMFELMGMEVVNTGNAEPLPHISRFLPSVRQSPKPFLFVWNMIVPGPPTICCVFVFGADRHPDSLGPHPDDPEDSDWQPFDFTLWRFLHGNDDERSSLFKMIPRIAEGSWVIRQSVGTTPVIVGRKLATSYWLTSKYVEVAVDVGSSSTAQYVTGMVRGGCKNLVLDLGVVLEGQHTWELPEVLLGAVRVKRLDLSAATTIDESKEVPILDVAAPDSASAVT